MTASSSVVGHNASMTVIDGQDNWLPKENDQYPWIQVDFAVKVELVEIMTQGSGSIDVQQWVKDFTISYADSDEIFTKLTHDSRIKVLTL